VPREESRIKAVVFDLDDTLYPERLYVRSGYRAVAEHLRVALGRRGRFEDWLWERFNRGRAAGAFEALNEHFNLGLSETHIGELVEVYRRHKPDIRCFDGIEELLERLAAEYRLGLLTDGFMPAQRLKLDALKLRPFFQAVVFTEEMGRRCWKPSPAGFRRVSELLATPHESCAYVADNPAKDFIAPNALGWRTIRYLRPGQVHAAKPAPAGGCPQSTVRRPSELQEALL